jgi:hypothetical protein
MLRLGPLGDAIREAAFGNETPPFASRSENPIRGITTMFPIALAIYRPKIA